MSDRAAEVAAQWLATDEGTAWSAADEVTRLRVIVAAVEALAGEWTTATCQTDGAPCSWHRVAAECATELRAALATGANQ